MDPNGKVGLDPSLSRQLEPVERHEDPGTAQQAQKLDYPSEPFMRKGQFRYTYIYLCMSMEQFIKL